MSNDSLWLLGGIAALVFFGMDNQASGMAPPSSSPSNTPTSNPTIGDSGLTVAQLTQVFSANGDVPASVIAAILAAPNAAAATAIENSWLASLTPTTTSLTNPYYPSSTYPVYENGQLILTPGVETALQINWNNQHNSIQPM
jgi:hypothetical protein